MDKIGRYELVNILWCGIIIAANKVPGIRMISTSTLDGTVIYMYLFLLSQTPRKASMQFGLRINTRTHQVTFPPSLALLYCISEYCFVYPALDSTD